MSVELIITLTIAIIGWLWAIYQYFNDRNRLKRDKLADRRYDAYFSYMRKISEINENVRKNPNAIYGMSTDFMKVLLTGDTNAIDAALCKFNEQTLDYVKSATEPLLIVKQELSALLLIASDELTVKIQELIILVEDFNSEMQLCLSSISSKDSQSFRNLETIGKDERFIKFKILNDDLLKLMRQEINLK